MESSPGQLWAAMPEGHAVSKSSSTSLSSSTSNKQPSEGKNDNPSLEAHQDLLTEHFGYNPGVFIDAIVYAANEVLYSIASEFEDYIKEQLIKRNKKKAQQERKSQRELDDEAEKGIYSILNLMENALDYSFDVIEQYCHRAVFGIRPSQASHLVLAHHRGLDLRTLEEKKRDGVVGAKSAKDEFLDLQDRELQLQDQIEKAKKVRHALRLATVSAKQNQERAQQFNDTFSILMIREDGNVQLPSVLPQSARKLSLDISTLLKSVNVLIKTDALGSSLLKSIIKSEKEKKRVMEESGASEEERRQWEKGRENYLNWESDRTMKFVAQQRSADVGNRSRLSMRSSLERRMTDETESQPVAVGSTSDLEQLAKSLQGS